MTRLDREHSQQTLQTCCFRCVGRSTHPSKHTHGNLGAHEWGRCSFSRYGAMPPKLHSQAEESQPKTKHTKNVMKELLTGLGSVLGARPWGACLLYVLCPFLLTRAELAQIILAVPVQPCHGCAQASNKGLTVLHGCQLCGCKAGAQFPPHCLHGTRLPCSSLATGRSHRRCMACTSSSVT